MSNPIIPAVPIGRLPTLPVDQVAGDDLFPVVDASDLSSGATGTTKHLTVQDLGTSVGSIPVVADDTARDTMFPTPRVGQRVQNIGSGQYERFDGSAWVFDVPTNPPLNLGYGILARNYSTYFNNTKTFALLNYRDDADGSDWSPAFARAFTAIKSYAPGLYTSAVLELPPGLLFLNSPVVLPRSGGTPANVIHIQGDSIRGTRIAGSATFPPFRALIEWESTPNRAWMQRISNVTFALPNIPGVMAIAYVPTYSGHKLVDGASITAASTTLTCPGAFSVGDVGKVIWIWGAGTSGKIHKTIIRSYTNSDTVEVSRAAVTTVTDAMIRLYVFGPGGYTTLTNVTTTAGSTTITSAGQFTSAMSGRTLLIDGAGPEGAPLPVTVTAYTNANTMTIRSPAITSVSGTTAAILTTSPNMTVERLQIDLQNIGVDGTNQYHPIGIYLGGNVVFSNIQNFHCDSTTSLGDKYDMIALLADEDATVDYRHPGGDNVGLQYSNVINYLTTPRRGGTIQLFRGRMNAVCVSNMESGNGTRTQPTLELVHSSACVFDGVHTEVRGEKPTFKLLYTKLCSFRGWSIGYPNDAGLGVGNGVELWASTDNRFYDGPAQWPGGPPPFSNSGVHLLYIDDYSYRNRFENFLLAGAVIANEVRFPSPDNDNYLEAWNPGQNAWQFLGTSVMGSIAIGPSRVPVVKGYSGTGALASGTATVADARVATGDVVVLSRTSQGTAPGILSYGNIVDGTSFDVTSNSASDDGTFAYQIVKP